MKNLLLIILAAGLGVSLYFNWKHCNSGGAVTSAKMLNLSDSTEISFTVLNEGTVMDSTQGTSTISIKSNFAASQSADQVGYGKVCCPIPPKDTASGVRNWCIDPGRIVGIQIKSLIGKP